MDGTVHAWASRRPASLYMIGVPMARLRDTVSVVAHPQFPVVWWEASVLGARRGHTAVDLPCAGTPRAVRALWARAPCLVPALRRGHASIVPFPCGGCYV